MFDEGAKQGVVVRHRIGSEVSLVEQFIEFDRREIGGGIGLDRAPDQLHGIQFRGVPRQEGGLNAMGIAFEPTFDGLPAMYLRAIPHQFDWSADGTAQLLEECQDAGGIEVGVCEQAKKAIARGTVAAIPTVLR